MSTDWVALTAWTVHTHRRSSTHCHQAMREHTHTHAHKRDNSPPRQRLRTHTHTPARISNAVYMSVDSVATPCVRECVSVCVRVQGPVKFSCKNQEALLELTHTLTNLQTPCGLWVLLTIGGIKPDCPPLILLSFQSVCVGVWSHDRWELSLMLRGSSSYSYRSVTP